MTVTPTPTDPEAFAGYIRQTLADLPDAFRAPAREVAVSVADWPPAEVLHDMGIRDPLELTGLYEGIPLTEKSLFEQPIAPDAIWLYRQPILAEWRDRTHRGENLALADLVAHVLIHELAHHFGWSDDDIAVIDRWWE